MLIITLFICIIGKMNLSGSALFLLSFFALYFRHKQMKWAITEVLLMYLPMKQRKLDINKKYKSKQRLFTTVFARNQAALEL
jgi:hypothetical protein